MKRFSSVIAVLAALCLSLAAGVSRPYGVRAEAEPVRVVKNDATVGGAEAVDVVPDGTTGKSVHLIRPDWRPVGGALRLGGMDKDKITLEMWIHISDLGSLTVGPFLPGNIGFTIEDNNDTARYFCYWLQAEDVASWTDGWNRISIRFSLLDKATYRRGWDTIDLSSMTFKMYAPMLEDLYLHDVFVKETEQTKANVLISSQPVVFPAKGISLSLNSLKIRTGGTAELEASLKPKSSAKNETVDWESSDEFVATVENGVITAVGEGSCTITASVRGRDLKAKAKVVVSDEIAVNPLNTVSPDIVSSLKEGAFDIDEKSIISPYSDGSVTRFGNFSGQTAGGLSNFSLANFELSNTVLEFNLLILDKGDFIGEGNPDEDEKKGYFGFGEPISTGLWSTNHIMYPIDGTLWNELSAGWNRIRVKVSAMKKTGNPNLSNLSFLFFQQHLQFKERANVGINGLKLYESEQTEDIVVDNRVELIEPTSVVFDCPEEMRVGRTYRLSAEIQPANATFRDFAVFTSSDESVIGIRPDGRAVALSAGTAVLRMSLFGDGNGYEKTVVVKEASAIPSSVSFDRKKITAKVGEKFTVDVSLSPSEAEGAEVCFVSDDTSVVCVDADGNVCVVGEGKATVTAYAVADPSKSATLEIVTEGYRGCSSAIGAEKTTGLIIALSSAFILKKRLKSKGAE